MVKEILKFYAALIVWGAIGVYISGHMVIAVDMPWPGLALLFWTILGTCIFAKWADQ